MKKPANQSISIAMAARRSAAMHPAILDDMRMDIVNYSALTNHLLPEITRLAGIKEVNKNAVKIALIRYGEQIAREWQLQEDACIRVLRETVVELRNDLFVITVRQGSIRLLQDVLKKVDEFRFFQLVKGTDSVTIAVDEHHHDFLLSFIDKPQILSSFSNQSALVLISPPLIIDVPGVLAYSTNLLSHYGVNITQMFSCHTDTVFIIDRSDAVKAFELIERKIRDLRAARK